MANPETPQGRITQAKGVNTGHDHDLFIYLLGSPLIIWSGEPLTIARRQVRALLYRLAADLQPIPRDQLCSLFWPDHSQPKARRSLTHLLTHLRHSLPQPDLMDFSKEYVALDRGRVWSDSVALEGCFSKRRVLLTGPTNTGEDLWPSLETCEVIFQSYRGPFLDSFSLNASAGYESWINQQRQYYERRYLEVLFDLMDYFQNRKQYEKAISYARRYLEVDNLAEEVHCKLIELYTASGDRGAAERQFELCVEMLEQELGVSPSPKTWAIYQSASGPRPSGLLISRTSLAEGPLAKLDTPFMGRNNILEAIEQAFNLASSGRSKLILMIGEPGSGKSRLLQHIAASYHNSGMVLFSACSQGLENLPFHPIAEAFRPVIESQNLSLNISPLWLAEAGRLLPEIYTRFPELPIPQPARPEEARRRLFEALYQLATSLQSRFRPLLVVLDDLHWADATTLEWLIYCANRLASDGSGHMLILSTCRREATRNLSELRSVFNRFGFLEEHSLFGFEIEDVIQILQHHIGSHEDLPGLANWFHQISGGNPFLLFGTLQALIDGHLIVNQHIDLDHLTVPKIIRDAIHQRLEPLSTLERKILEILAVLRNPIRLEMIRLIIDSEELEILEALDELMSARLVTEQRDKYHFAYELLGLVIYNDISYGQRRYLHRQCALVLEKYYPEKIALLAWQFERSGEPGKAASYALNAGESSLQALAFSEALDFFSRAIVSLKEDATDLTSPEKITANYRMQIQALSRRSYVFRSLGEMQPYLDDIAEEARIASALNDQTTLALVYSREANAHRWFCRYRQAQESAEKALIIGQATGDRSLQAHALREIGLAQRATGNFDQASRNLQAAWQHFRDLGEIDFEIHTLGNLSTLYTYMADLSQAEKLAYKALALCEQSQIPYLRRIALGDLGVVLSGSGQLEQARECLLTSLDLSREISDRTQEIFCLCHLGWLENAASRPDQALSYLRDGLALAERLDSRSEQSRLYAGLAEAHLLLNNLRLAKSFAAKSLEIAKRHGRVYDQHQAEQIIAKSGEKL